MSTISPSSSMVSPCSFTVKPASSRILSAVRDSPTLASFWSMKTVASALPRTTDTATNASQPKTAVFQWLALQRPIRAAKAFDSVRGVTVVLLSALQLQGGELAEDVAEAEASIGGVGERVVEGVERVGARDLELELVVEPRVGDGDLGAVGRAVPEEHDGETVVLAARELGPVPDAGERGVDGGVGRG